MALVLTFVQKYCFLQVVEKVMNQPMYLYLEEGVGVNSVNENSPVVEYIAPASPQQVKHDGASTSNSTSSLNPDFLYQPSSTPEYMPPPRVVVFYAPW